MAEYNNGLKDELNLPQSSVSVLEARYLIKDNHGKIIETGEDMLRRVARDIASGESDIEKAKEFEKKFFEIMSKRYFLPNSPTLMNAGRKLQQLSACFVLPIEDSMEGIFETQKSMAIVHKSGGGTGFSFSRLRPNGAFIHSTSGHSPGPLSFLFGYNENAGQITQGGKRRGANMGILRANHPDALCWARAKEKEGQLKNFNLSIAFSNEEIEAIKEDGYILMEDPRPGKTYTIENAEKRVKEIHFGTNEKFITSWKISKDEKSVIDSISRKEIGKVENNKIYLRARSLFGVIVEGAWKKGEPGIIFLGRMNEANPTPEIGEIESTNPCGEQPLLPYESCNLGSINLSEMINPDGKIDEILLEQTIRLATRFLDNVIDKNKYSLKEIEDITKANRKIGLGVMGFAHMLVKMGVSYNSPEAIKIAEKVMKFINNTSKDESRKLAKEKGEFPNFSRSIYKNGEPIRNSTTTTIAPTGTIGVIASTSQGIEPIFKLITLRKVKDTLGQDLIETDRMFKEYLQNKGLYDEEIMRKMEEEGLEFWDIPEFSGVRDEIKRLFVTAHDIPTEQHLRIQAAFQKYTDNAVSKTINMPSEATKEDVANAYLMAYDLGCKGLTIYRDKSREFELLTDAGKKDEIKEGYLLGKIDIEKEKRPKLIGTTVKQQTPHGTAFITFNCFEDNGLQPYEIFINIGKGGRDVTAIAEGFGRLLSLAFKSGVPLKYIIEQLGGISGETQAGFGVEKIFSLPDAIAKGLREAYSQLGEVTSKEKLKKEKRIEAPEGKIINSGNFCPDCGGSMIHSEGCQKCLSCGYSKC
ncbi:MAG: adenosylcobalamin-dependent ribonucleoside-diphosphate reductase [Nanoarchaeota archaeon]|nr:adenosylcobalamin-dependent ribonucleoside-diphosphate reductase [Nanoarchaeota archaeon]